MAEAMRSLYQLETEKNRLSLGGSTVHVGASPIYPPNLNMTNLNNYNTNLSIPDNSQSPTDYKAEMALMDHLNQNRVHQDFRTDKLPIRKLETGFLE